MDSFLQPRENGQQQNAPEGSNLLIQWRYILPIKSNPNISVQPLLYPKSNDEIVQYNPNSLLSSSGSHKTEFSRDAKPSSPSLESQETSACSESANIIHRPAYQRTAIACGACRRRKMRCRLDPADPQNRCSDCIRLKKECNFYPVDQQPVPEPRRRGSKAQSGTGRASESSSPSTSSGQLPELPPTLPYPHLSMPPIQDLGAPQIKKQRTESFSPENKVVTSSRSFDYNHGANWTGLDQEFPGAYFDEAAGWNVSQYIKYYSRVENPVVSSETSPHSDSAGLQCPDLQLDNLRSEDTLGSIL